ncbi:hypothetical protein HAX54_043753 [Datura stramonium]|uniref:Uncharacterized protein n=1 Tax=Datura stramonium TaxID=4076 RepID=A0ABS8W5P5_DATST|nr:hypothetical protein [Datura stramonium]
MMLGKGRGIWIIIFGTLRLGDGDKLLLASQNYRNPILLSHLIVSTVIESSLFIHRSIMGSSSTDAFPQIQVPAKYVSIVPATPFLFSDLFLRSHSKVHRRLPGIWLSIVQVATYAIRFTQYQQPMLVGDSKYLKE